MTGSSDSQGAGSAASFAAMAARMTLLRPKSVVGWVPAPRGALGSGHIPLQIEDAIHGQSGM